MADAALPSRVSAPAETRHEEEEKENVLPPDTAEGKQRRLPEGLFLKRGSASAVRLSAHEQQQLSELRQLARLHVSTHDDEEGKKEEEKEEEEEEGERELPHAKLRRMGQLGRRSTPLRELFQQASLANSSDAVSMEGKPREEMLVAKRTEQPKHADQLAGVVRVGKRKSDAETVLERLGASGDAALNSPSKRRRTVHQAAAPSVSSLGPFAPPNASRTADNPPRPSEDDRPASLPHHEPLADLHVPPSTPRCTSAQPAQKEEPEPALASFDALAASLDDVDTRPTKRESFLRRTFSVKKLKSGTCTSNSDPRIGFLRLLTEQDMAVSCALLEIGGEDVAKHIVTVLDGVGQALRLMKGSLSRELNATTSEGTLFRGASVSTQLASVYMRIHGESYLKAALGPFFETLLSRNVRLEVDPNRAPDHPPDMIERDCLELGRLCRVLLDALFCSTADVPHAFRELFAYLRSEVVTRFPDMQDKAIGGFFFLRFLCPALVSPEQLRLVSGTVPPAVRRTLILISKVVQNIANELEFGEKEAYMGPMNPLVHDEIPRMKQFLDTIASASGSARIARDLTLVWSDDEFLGSLFAVYDMVSHNMERLRSHLTMAGHAALADDLQSATKDLPPSRDEQMRLARARPAKSKKAPDRPSANRQKGKDKRPRRSLSDTELDLDDSTADTSSTKKRDTPGRRQLNRLLSTSKKLLPKFASDQAEVQADQAATQGGTPRKFLKATRRKASVLAS